MYLHMEVVKHVADFGVFVHCWTHYKCDLDAAALSSGGTWNCGTNDGASRFTSTTAKPLVGEVDFTTIQKTWKAVHMPSSGTSLIVWYKHRYQSSILRTPYFVLPGTMSTNLLAHQR